MRGRLKVSLPWLDGHLRKVGSTGSVSARASKYRCAELKRPVTQAASKMPSNATVLRRSQFSSARAVARDLTEPVSGHGKDSYRILIHGPCVRTERPTD